MAGDYDPDDQIRKRRETEPLFLGSKEDPITGDLVGGPSIPRGKDRDGDEPTQEDPSEDDAEEA